MNGDKSEDKCLAVTVENVYRRRLNIIINCLYFCTTKAWLHGGAVTQLGDAILDLLE